MELRNLARMACWFVLCVSSAEAQEPPPSLPPSLKRAKQPEPNLEAVVKDRAALVQLGKALFWDMQVGSDGIQACASCHFHAGTDGRLKNQVNPGHRHFTFKGPNQTLRPENFPFHKLAHPDDRDSTVLFDTNDRVSSQGIHGFVFGDIIVGSDQERTAGTVDTPFEVGGILVRRVEPRSTPSVINAGFNLRNFWDGRADRFFNGRNPFGELVSAFILVADGGKLVPKSVRIQHSSLASQAVGPPLSELEMSYAGRTFEKLGKKLLALRPLQKQEVHPEDSVLGPLRHESGKGLSVSYRELIERAFLPRYWKSDLAIVCNGRCDRVSRLSFIPAPSSPTTNQYSLMEFNFSLFFGLAVQAYEMTLVSDDAPFDRFLEGDENALTAEQKRGLDIFMNEGRCIQCHKGPELSGAALTHLVAETNEFGLVERMRMADLSVRLYDNGFYNIGVRRASEDRGLGGRAPNGEHLSFTRRFQRGRFTLVDPCTFEVPFGDPNDAVHCSFMPSESQIRKERTAVDGAFKVPILRNVELTGPYMHNGGMSTLLQVVEFYDRGGDFDPQDPDIQPIGLSQDDKRALVAFLLSLTDERVRHERAPFDHPQLCVPDGHPGDHRSVIDAGNGAAKDTLLNIPAVGQNGGPALLPFEKILELGANPHASGTCP